ncbi:MAG: family phosphatase [Clostridiales bacterium]|jgi:Cof subfamily protein (haloacid dehalogenase superfamily)|nr:family phosphatase [Clostridiales bacterium]
MKYKMIAMDMDGTLLTTDKQVSQRSKEVLKKATDAGIKLVVCTGRIFTSAWIFADLIGTEAPIIASNGAYIREKDRDEVVYMKALLKEQINKVVKIVKKHGFYPHLFSSDTIFTEKVIFTAKLYDKQNQSLPKDKQVKIVITDDLEKVIEENHEIILKVVIVSEMDEIESLSKLRNEISKELDVSIMASAANNIEIMSKGISKGNAVKILGDIYGISSEETICIGDNENDISMIEYAGLGVAMANASDVLKTVANYVTDTNDNDGVAKAIEKFALKNEE